MIDAKTQLRSAINEFNSAKSLQDVNSLYQKHISISNIDINYASALTKMRLGYNSESIQNLKNISIDFVCNQGDDRYV